MTSLRFPNSFQTINGGAPQLDTSVIIEYNRNSNNFKLIGQDRLKLASASASIVLSYDAITAIASLFQQGTFDHILDNRMTQQRTSVPFIERGTTSPPSAPTPVDTPVTGSASASTTTTTSATSPSSTSSTAQVPTSPTSDDMDSSSGSGSKTNLWQSYLKMYKQDHPHLTHAQAQKEAKLTYYAWKATQE